MSTTTETAPFEYPTLPQAADTAFNFWCVFLEGCAGPTPAIPRHVKEAPVADVESPWEDLGFTIPMNTQQQHALERRKPKLRRQKNGRLDLQDARMWQHAFEHNKRYYEDPAHAAKGINPRVIGVTLYCPLNEAIGPNGTLEDHGAYMAVGQRPTGALPFAGKPGECPKCRTPEQKAQALKEIVSRYRWASIDLPDATVAAMANRGVI